MIWCVRRALRMMSRQEDNRSSSEMMVIDLAKLL